MIQLLYYICMCMYIFLQFIVILGSVISTLITFSLVSLQEPENILAKYGL